MIRLAAMDVDGTLTDGGIYMDGDGGEFKRFNVKDGFGIVSLKKSGVEVAFISGRFSAATEQRARDLGVEHVVNGRSEKLPELIALAGELGLDASEVAFIGDDVQDIPCINWAGLGIAVADAQADVIAVADWVSSRRGGEGAVRDAADYIAQVNREAG
jgi:3-deoxy-D-manno-octulosonate 8-phosphate phosphatase (KDO 8-P phosphatase)